MMLCGTAKSPRSSDIDGERDGKRPAHSRVDRLRDEEVPDEANRVEERSQEDEITRHAVGEGKGSAHAGTTEELAENVKRCQSSCRLNTP